MNPGKLDDLDVLDQIFTPSFNLLELEARILQHGQLEELAKAHRPLRALRQVQARLLRLPPGARDVLPPAQQEPGHRRAHRGAALRRPARALHPLRAAPLAGGGGRPLHHLPQVPEALPGGHRHRRGLGPRAGDPGGPRATSGPAGATAATLRYLDSRSPALQPAVPPPVLRHRRGAAARRLHAGRAAAAGSTAAPGSYALQLLRSPVPPGRRGRCATCCPDCERRPGAALRAGGRGEARPSSTSRAAARSGSTRRISHGRDPRPAPRDRDAGGAAAALPLLRLPGPRQRARPSSTGAWCCATPSSSARSATCSPTSSSTRAWSPAAPAWRGWSSMEAAKIFGAPVVDVAALRRWNAGSRLEGERRLPLPRPLPRLAGRQGRRAAGASWAASAAWPPVPHCCSEAGTLALSRPDITDAMLHRKARGPGGGDGRPRQRHGGAHQLPVLRAGAGAQPALGVVPRHLAVALARAALRRGLAGALPRPGRRGAGHPVLGVRRLLSPPVRTSGTSCWNGSPLNLGKIISRAALFRHWPISVELSACSSSVG